MHNAKGFTLLEVVISLAMVGLMALVAGMGLVSLVQGYAFTRENVAMIQKAQLSMSRISRELTALSDIDSDNSTATCIIYKRDTESQYNRAIGLNGNNLELKVSSVAESNCAATGYPLVDNVANFAVSYKDQSGTDLPVSFALSDLRTITVSFTLNRSDGSPAETFAITVNPRNIGNLNAPGFSL